jgi:hypothetical protein
MHFNQSRLGAGAAALAGALTVAVAASSTALAGQTNKQAGGHAQSTALPNWYHSPLSSAQINAEVVVPKALDHYSGPMRLTHDAFTAGSGALAVDAGQALGHALAKGEHLQLTNAFVLNGATPSAATRSEFAKLAWSNVTSVTCEGYTDYGPHSYNRDQLLGRARATAICSLLQSHDSSVATKIVTYGSTRPAKVGGPVNTHHAENRRVVVDITGVTSAVTKTSNPAPVVTTAVVTPPVATTPVVTPPVVTTPTINVPLAPTIVSATPGDGATTLTIAPPSSDATITGYQYSIDGGTTWLPLTTTGTTTLTATVTGLTDGTSYSVEVRAQSSAGNGAASSGTSVTPAGVPGAPNLLTGTADPRWPNDWWVTLTWTAPTSDGGSSITDWDITQDDTDLGPASTLTSDNGVTDTSGTYSITFDTGWDYCGWYDAATPYTVEGVNSIGEGVSSQTVDIDMRYPC